MTDPRQTFLDSLGGELAVNDPALFAAAYPAHTLTCASEIFNIWVCRMIMLGYHFTDRPPFEHVFIHAVVRDEKGRKMSKSLGNGIDPEEMMQKYSADSLRMALNSLIVPGRDALLSKKSAEELIIKWRNFGNKLWNISRFLYDREEPVVTTTTISAASGWIWEKLENLAQSIDKDMREYRLGQVMDNIYHFVWDDLADWYIEYLKTDSEQLYFAQKHVFEPLVKLIHPFVPFETEVIWSQIQGGSDSQMLINQKFELVKLSSSVYNSAEFELIKGFVSEFRKIRGLYRIDPVLKIKLFSNSLVLSEYTSFLGLIARLDVSPLENLSTNQNYFTQSWNGVEFSFDLVSIIPDLRVELKRTEDDLNSTQKEIDKLFGLLNNSGFINKASEETVDKTKQDYSLKLEYKKELETKLTWLKEHIN